MQVFVSIVFSRVQNSLTGDKNNEEKKFIFYVVLLSLYRSTKYSDKHYIFAKRFPATKLAICVLFYHFY